MQTLSVPYRISLPDQAKLTAWRKVYSSAVRQAYVASVHQPDGTCLDEKTVRAAVIARHGQAELGATLLQNAVLEGRKLARQYPDGKLIFGGRKLFEQRGQQAIDRDTWRLARLMPLFIQGKMNEQGNRLVRFSGKGDQAVLRLSSQEKILAANDNRGAQVDAPSLKAKRSKPRIQQVTFDLIPLQGRQGRLFQDLVAMAVRSDITLSVRIDDTCLHLTFDEADLRRLDPGQTLTHARDADIAAGKAKRKGRKRKDDYVPHQPMAYPKGQSRPVHPLCKTPLPGQEARRLGLDLNPSWIGMSVVEHSGDPTDLGQVQLHDHLLVHMDLRDPATTDRAELRRMLADTADCVIALARAWHVPELVLEKGLGYLRSSGTDKDTNHRNNRWPRTLFHAALERRAKLAGILVRYVPAYYSTTIGNVMFEVPDAIASSAEIGRRGFLDLASAPDQGPPSAAATAPALTAPNIDKTSAKVETSAATSSLPTSSEFIRPLTPFMQRLLPRFNPDLLPDPWKKTVAGARDWVQAHGIIKTVTAASHKGSSIGLRRPHPAVPLPGSQGRHAGLPAGLGLEVAPLGWKTRPGWVFRPSRALCRPCPVVADSVNRP